MSCVEEERKLGHSLDVERTLDVKLSEDITFEGLVLAPRTLEGLTKCGFLRPSPIQLKAIPLGKCGFDLIVEAKSGTGKTAVFSVVALESLQLDLGCQCIIVAPTREIAVQVKQVITSIGVAYEGLNVELAIGGTDITEDITRLSGTPYQIIVGTPGRLKHFINNKILSTSSVRLVVLDEADRLMDKSFENDVNHIYFSLPERKQVIVASATYSDELKVFLRNYMTSVSHVNPYSTRLLLGVDQFLSLIDTHSNRVKQLQIIMEELDRILSNVQFKQCLIFCNYQWTTHHVWKYLCNNGWPAEYLSSSQTQGERLNSLNKLQSYECRILVATDLASRGLDAANIDLVINHEIPYDLSTYLHRIGRCGRYGAKGNAITILPDKEETKFKTLLKTCGDSFDIKPIENLIKGSKEIKECDTFEKTEIKPNILEKEMDLTPLFVADTSKVDNILKSYNIDSVDKLFIPNSGFTLDDFYAPMKPKDTHQNFIPEFDQIEYLKKTVPNYDELTDYIMKKYILNDNKEDVDIKTDVSDFKEEVQSVDCGIDIKEELDNTKYKEEEVDRFVVADLEKKTENIPFKTFDSSIVNGKQKKRSNYNIASLESAQLPKAFSSTTHRAKTRSSFSDNRLLSEAQEELDDVDNRQEEYLEFRQRLTAMTNAVQQSVYLASLMNDLYISDSDS